MAESHSSHSIKVIRDGRTKTIRADQIVCGDLVIIENNWEVPCDLAVVQGQVVANESNLTGESLPIQKFPVNANSDVLDPDGKHGKPNFLSAGTNVIALVGVDDASSASVAAGSSGALTPSIPTSKRTFSSRGALKRCIGIAARTGSYTSKGQLVRNILFPTTVKFKFDEHLPVVFLIMFLFGVAMVATIASAIDFLPAMFYGLSSLCQCVPMWAIVILTMGQTRAAERLKKDQQVYTLAPDRIVMAGKLRVMCFDKTGTLTQEGLNFVGCQPIEQKGPIYQFAPVASFTPAYGRAFQYRVPPTMLQAMASCHTLALIPTDDGKRTLIGSELEKRMLEATGWMMKEVFLRGGDNATVVMPPNDDAERTGPKCAAIEILKEYEFDHGRQAQVVIGADLQTKETVIYAKGSYEKIEKMCSGGIPHDYLQVAQSHAREGIYVLAIARRVLRDADNPMKASEVDSIDRDDAEKDMTMVGLILFRNDVKPESENCIRQLKEGSVRSVIVTGDNALTGVYVATAIGMVDQPIPRSKLSTVAYDGAGTMGGVLLGEIHQGVVRWSNFNTGEEVPAGAVYTSSVSDWL
eukprot:GHVN01053440.1.p1 GENE.GHVN01053440.1~~GHVN01053440.1.p1  ORF type:complete len:597 (-),score=110.88 GHVN01053440.1:897-2636(-)